MYLGWKKQDNTMAKASKNAGIARILTIIGGAFMIYNAVMGFINANNLINAIILLIVGLVTLGTTGIIKPIAKVGFNGIVLIILGVLGIIFGSLFGGIFTIVAAILLFL